MIIFVVYAIATWFAAYHWRRRWEGWLILALSLFGLLAVAWFHTRLNEFLDRSINLVVLRILLFPYIVLVISLALMLVVQKRIPRGDYFCRRCMYDFDGLDPVDLRCPECDTLWCGPGSGHEPPPLPPLTPIPTGPPKTRAHL